MLKDSQLVSREVLSPQPLPLFLRPWLYVFLPLARGGPQPPGTVRSGSRGLQVQDLPIPTAPPETVESQAGGLSEPLGPCQLAGLDPLCGGDARAAVTLVAVQSPEPLPGGPVAALALCPTVPLLPSGSLWRLPASLPPIIIVCAGFIFSGNLFQQMPSGCARRWAGCSAAARVMAPGFTVRLTGMSHQHPYGRPEP